MLTAVRTTGIYCRPGCSARPDPANTEPFLLPAAAEAAGFRACHRCRPYREDVPLGAVGPDLVCRAVRLVVDGALDDGTEVDLAARLGISARHLRRLFDQHLGVTPDGLARSRRAHFARRLLDDTDLPVTDVAFAAGFGSVRQLQRACVETFGDPPTALRARRRRGDRLVADGGLDVRLGAVGGIDADALLSWLAARAVPGVESVGPAPGGDGSVHRRTIIVEGHPGAIEVRAEPTAAGSGLVLRAHLPHWEGLIHIVERTRRLAGADVDPAPAVAALCGAPLIGPLVAARPAVRTPGAWDPFEAGVRAIVGQQVGLRSAATVLGRLAADHGERIDGLDPMGLHAAFPDAPTLAEADLRASGLTEARAATLRSFAAAVASGHLDLEQGAGRSAVVEHLLAIKGIGPWTAGYLSIRLGDPDAFCPGDLVLRRTAGRIAGTGPMSAAGLEEVAERWRPWRALAATHLWLAAAPSPARRAGA
jgi:AraC family transcriptional regulator of adaptative response / DNA-3-methyladenine glycosylase II